MKRFCWNWLVFWRHSGWFWLKVSERSEKLPALWTLPKPPRPKPAAVLRSAKPPSPKRAPPAKEPPWKPLKPPWKPPNPPPWKPPKPPPWKPPNPPPWKPPKPPPWKPPPPRNATARSAPIATHAAIAAPASSAPASFFRFINCLVIDILPLLLGCRNRRERDFLRARG